MKKIKLCVFAMLLAVSVLAMTACGNKESNNNQTTSPSGTTQSTSAAGSDTNSSESSTSGTNGGNTSTTTSGYDQDNYDDDDKDHGVLDDMADDVEEGMDDLINGPGATSASDETR